MKEPYMAPDIQVEYYQLDANIASNCHRVINMGPEGDGHPSCSDWEDWENEETETVTPSALAKRAPSAQNYNTQNYTITFYENGDGKKTCDCYYTAAQGFWSS